MTGDLSDLDTKFKSIGYKTVKKGGLTDLWHKSNILTSYNVLKAILSEESISMMKRGIKKNSKVIVTPEEIIGAIRRLLNESALSEMEKIKISLRSQNPANKSRPLHKKKPVSKTVIEQAEDVIKSSNT
jgi:hypothetical protein